MQTSKTWLLVGTLLALINTAYAQQDHQALLQKVKQEREQERRHMAEREARFIQNKELQAQALQQAQEEFERYQRANNPLQQQTERNSSEIQKLKDQIAQRKREIGDVEGVLEHMASDFSAALQQSPTSMRLPERSAKVETIQDPAQGLSLSRLETLWLLVQEEMTLAGNAHQFIAPVVQEDGQIEQQRVYQFGGFSSYTQQGFLQYIPETREFLTVAGSSRENQVNQAFFQSNAYVHTLYVDPSNGSLLNLLAWSPDLHERFEQSGVIGKIIVVIGALGALIIVWRMLILLWQQYRLQRQLQHLETPTSDNALGRVLLKLSSLTLTPMALSKSEEGDAWQALQLQVDEALIHELNTLERGQNLLKLLAAIAPLLGLLGTVTGMIITFQSISFFGSGDPKLMAGGISQALMTTVLGLMVAIPLLFGHSFLNSLSEGISRRLEEQTTSLLTRTLVAKQAED